MAWLGVEESEELLSTMLRGSSGSTNYKVGGENFEKKSLEKSGNNSCMRDVDPIVAV